MDSKREGGCVCYLGSVSNEVTATSMDSSTNKGPPVLLFTVSCLHKLKKYGGNANFISNQTYKKNKN